MDLRHLDLFPLRCLHALVTEEHVTRASDRMGISQPQMSATLKRLRELFMDQILVRTENGMVATPRAKEIARSIGAAIDSIDATLRNSIHFDPMTDQHTFHIAASESVGLLTMPRISAALRQESSAVIVRMHTPNMSSVRQELEDGRIDLALAYFRDPPEGLRFSPLTSQKLLVIAGKSHPTIQGRIDLEAYLQASHARYALDSFASSPLEDGIDEALRQLGAVRSTGIQLPSAVALPPVVAATDLIATVPEEVARVYARALDLQVLEPPFALPDIAIRMYWHDRTHTQPAVRWLRDLIQRQFVVG